MRHAFTATVHCPVQPAANAQLNENATGLRESILGIFRTCGSQQRTMVRHSTCKYRTNIAHQQHESPPRYRQRAATNCNACVLDVHVQLYTFAQNANPSPSQPASGTSLELQVASS